jgi:hypothetical protein
MKAPRAGAGVLKGWLLSFFLAAIFSAPAWADATSAKTALPGTLNYVEGQVSMGNPATGGKALDSKSIGAAELGAGQTLTTDAGKAEVLLTPGVFLRIGSNSTVRMISPNLTDTHVGIVSGHAIVEVDEIHPENNIRVTENRVTTRLLATGLYDFNQRQEVMRVFDGKAVVERGSKGVIVKGGHEFSFTPGSRLKAVKFEKNNYEEGDLYRWSSLRSAYVAEANVNAASLYADDGYGAWGMGWWGADWYWDPWFDAFTFIPGDGIFYSPFGWGFYSPWYVWGAPGYGYGWGYGYPGYHHFSENYHNWGSGSHYLNNHYARGIYTGQGSSGHGGFHSGPSMAGGFRGGNAGFGHGGGFGGHGGGFAGHGGGFGGHGGGFGGGFGGGGHGR